MRVSQVRDSDQTVETMAGKEEVTKEGEEVVVEESEVGGRGRDIFRLEDFSLLDTIGTGPPLGCFRNNILTKIKLV